MILSSFKNKMGKQKKNVKKWLHILLWGTY